MELAFSTGLTAAVRLVATGGATAVTVTLRVTVLPELSVAVRV